MPTNVQRKTFCDDYSDHAVDLRGLARSPRWAQDLGLFNRYEITTTQIPETQNPPSGRRTGSTKIDRREPEAPALATESFPDPDDLRKPCLITAPRAGICPARRPAMFQIVAVPFEAFQSLPSAQHRWLLVCLARYVDKAGTAFPAMRQLAQDAGISLATVSRRLADLARLGVFQRERLPGGGRYRYVLAEPYRPRWPDKADNRVSAPQKRSSHGASPDQALPGKHVGKSFARSGTLVSEVRDDRDQWDARVRSWQNSGGRFWLPQWGPRPTEAGCFVPLSLLQGLSGRPAP